MKRINKTITLILAIVMVFFTGFNSFASSNEVFSDIENHWGREYILDMVDKGVLKGYPDRTFRPDNHMTKVEFYKLINELVGYYEKAKVNFEDVNKSDWFYDEVSKALAEGYIKEDKILNPNAYITREEVARIIGVINKLDKNVKETYKFKDYFLISLSAKGYVGTLKEKGYVHGYPDGTFGPWRNITRAEVAKMIFIVVESEGIPEIKAKEIKKPIEHIEDRGTGNVDNGGGGSNAGSGGGTIPVPRKVESVNLVVEDYIKEERIVYVKYQDKLQLDFKAIVSPTNAEYETVTWNVYGSDLFRTNGLIGTVSLEDEDRTITIDVDVDGIGDSVSIVVTDYETSEPEILEGTIPIADAEELSNIRFDEVNRFGKGTEYEGLYVGGTDKDYFLVKDIDLKELNTWSPISEFSGNIDGNGYEIINLNSYYGGLFRVVDRDALVENMILEVEIDVDEEIIVGALAGSNRGIISNSYVRGNIRSADKGIFPIAGLVGNNRGTIEKSYSEVNITREGIESQNTGGLVGQNNGTVLNSYSSGRVTGYWSVGGLVGHNEGLIEDSYSIADVYSDRDWNVGGLVGGNYGEIVSSYYYKEPENQLGTFVNMEDLGLEDTLEGWDFDYTWIMENGFPTIRSFY